MWETLELRQICELRDPRFSVAVRSLAITPDESMLITGDDGVYNEMGRTAVGMLLLTHASPHTCTFLRWSHCVLAIWASLIFRTILSILLSYFNLLRLFYVLWVYLLLSVAHAISSL